MRKFNDWPAWDRFIFNVNIFFVLVVGLTMITLTGIQLLGMVSVACCTISGIAVYIKNTREDKY